MLSLEALKLDTKHMGVLCQCGGVERTEALQSSQPRGSY